jgi:hypothetical protein
MALVSRISKPRERLSVSSTVELLEAAVRGASGCRVTAVVVVRVTAVVVRGAAAAATVLVAVVPAT